MREESNPEGHTRPTSVFAIERAPEATIAAAGPLMVGIASTLSDDQIEAPALHR